MRCIEIKNPGPNNILEESNRDIPIVNYEDVLIKVEAAGVNRADIFQALGQYPPPSGVTDIPGLEISGTIIDVGKSVSRFKNGDRVCALLQGGGYAEYAKVDQATCLSIPKNLKTIEAASFPESVFTVWHNIFERGKLQQKESLLIHGGASGIGTTAIQMAKAINAKVIITASSDEKCEACLKLGADIAINYNRDDFSSIIKELKPKGVDVILDMVGGDYIPKNIQSLRNDGRIIFISFLKGSLVEIDWIKVMLKRLVVTGSTLRSQSNEKKSKIANQITKEVWPWIEKNKIKPVIHKVLPFSKVNEAHSIMTKMKNIGKILLTP